MDGTRNAYKILDGNPSKRKSVRPKPMLKGKRTIYRKHTGLRLVEWIQPTQVSDKSRAL